MVAKKEENVDDDASLNTNPSIGTGMCHSTCTDPNTRTGMSITRNLNLCILVPTYVYIYVPLEFA
jgi:hypothetical protein